MQTLGCVWEHNGDDSLLYSVEFPGAFARGETLEAALGKMEREVRAFLRWRGTPADGPLSFEIVQEAPSRLDIRDADSDVLFAAETGPLSRDTYRERKALALKSAADFQALYDAVPEKDVGCAPARRTFYGPVPRTASEMYAHVLHVNATISASLAWRLTMTARYWIVACAGLPRWRPRPAISKTVCTTAAMARTGRCASCCAVLSGTTAFTRGRCGAWRRGCSAPLLCLMCSALAIQRNGEDKMDGGKGLAKRRGAAAHRSCMRAAGACVG